MSIYEKIIADYNIFYEECMKNFSADPTAIAYRLAIATELYENITEKIIDIKDYSDDKLMRMLDLENIFESFCSCWMTKQGAFMSLVEDVFYNMTE